MRCEKCGTEYDPDESAGCPTCANSEPPHSRRPNCGCIVLAGLPLLVLLLVFLLVILRAAMVATFVTH